MTDLQEDMGNGIPYLLHAALAKLLSRKRSIEMKGQLSEVCPLTVGDSCILLTVSKAKFQLKPGSVIIQNFAPIHYSLFDNISMSSYML